ncbi:OsmC family protein [Reichenbachiella sp. MALMAid0571]|uniref:OsmC family protein n=1 Tax=Reichenbachiella sp. MALMAid0571 TaxID=3143939 RepID=UPI0032DE7281
MSKEHNYTIEVKWTGNLGKGTQSSAAYTRDHEISKKTGGVILGSSDPVFKGNPERYNPEELLLSTLSACHMLMYLHFCSDNQITVVEYIDNSVGVMEEEARGSGHFVSATLKPRIKILEADRLEKAVELHHQSHEYCFIANSINFPLNVEPEIEVVR